MVATILCLDGFGLVAGTPLEGLKGSQGEPCLVLVRPGNVLHHADSLLVLALVHEELGAFTEVEQEEPQAEHGEGDASQREEEVAPAHVVVAPAARHLATIAATCGGGGVVVTRRERVGFREVGAAGHGRDEGEGDGGTEDHADGLEDGQGGEEKAFVLGEELERDGRVDGDVAAHAETDEGCEDEEGGVVVRGA